MKPKKLHKSLKKSRHKTSQKNGLPPGSLVYIGKERTHLPTILLTTYSQDTLSENEVDISQLSVDKHSIGMVNWLHLNAIHNIELIDQLGKAFSIEPLVLEDILNTNHLPKVEEVGEYWFFNLKHVISEDENLMIDYEQISLLLGSKWVLSFQENTNSAITNVQDRIRQARGKIRSNGNDYLIYTIIDNVVDSYFPVLERLGQNIDELEDEMNDDPTSDKLIQLQGIKQQLLGVRKNIIPLRDGLMLLLKSDTPLLINSTKKYYQDINDHIAHLLENVESSLEVISSLRDLYLTKVNLRMNQNMQVLTTFTAIFTPLTFIAGVYGMNFKNMPELSWEYGYFMILGFMMLIGLGLLFFFKRRKWM